MLVGAPGTRRTSPHSFRPVPRQTAGGRRPSFAHGLFRGAAREAPQHSQSGFRSLWERFSDDRDLFRLKIILLAGLVALVAILERV